MPAAVFLFPLVVLRVILGELEESHLRTVFRFPLQRKWASSFKVTDNDSGDNAIPMLQYVSLRRTWPLISIYCFFSVSALALLPPQIRFFSHRWRMQSIPDEFEGSLPFAVSITMLANALGLIMELPVDKIRFDPMLAVALPYLWTCVELVLRDSYVLWLFAHNHNPSSNAEIAVTEDHPISDLRDQWYHFAFDIGVMTGQFVFGFFIFALCIEQPTAWSGGILRPLLMAWAAFVLLLGCYSAFGAYETFFGRKCWLELKMLMLASGLLRLRNRD